MGGISGFCDFSGNLLQRQEESLKIAEKMGRKLQHRGRTVLAPMSASTLPLPVRGWQ